MDVSDKPVPVDRAVARSVRSEQFPDREQLISSVISAVVTGIVTAVVLRQLDL